MPTPTPGDTTIRSRGCTTGPATSFGGELPIALHENGPIPDPGRLRSADTRWVLFATWHGEHLPWSNSIDHLNSVYPHEYVITRDELPNLH